MNFVCIVFELGDKTLTLSSMENLIVQCNRKDDIIRQRHLPDGFLKTQGTSTFATVSPECPLSPIRRDKISIIFVYAGFSTRRHQTLI